MNIEWTKSIDVDRVKKDLIGTSRNMWLAGLGVVAQVEEKGRGLFDDFVERGRKVETRQFKAIDRTVARTTDTLKEWSDRVESSVQGSMEGVLHRIGLPSRQDLEKLSGRLNALSKKVDQVAPGA